MQSTPPTENEFNKSSVNIEVFLLIILAMIVGFLIAILLLPDWLPNLATSLTGGSPKVYWYLSRCDRVCFTDHFMDLDGAGAWPLQQNGTCLAGRASHICDP